MFVNCKNCTKEFDKKLGEYKRTKNHFCSKSCAATFNNLGVVHNKRKKRICTNCPNSFFRSKKYRGLLCPPCQKKFYEKLSSLKSCAISEYNQKLSVRGKHPSWRNAHIRSFARSWNRNKTKDPCAHCGYSKHVELAHIRAVSVFPLTATLGEINDSSNIIQLCRNCHWEFDNGIWSL